MINFQDRAASDDAAQLAKTVAAMPPASARKTTKTRSVVQRMADLFCENQSRDEPTTDKDLWLDGFTPDDIHAHLPAARTMANRRMTRRMSQSVAQCADQAA